MIHRSSLRVTIRKMLGRKGTFLLRNIFSELFFKLGYYIGPLNEKKENGISAMVCTYNDEDWVAHALLSVKDLVNEYVVIDSSTDRTPEIINELRVEQGLNIKMIRLPPGNLAYARITALKNTSYSWILVLDADMVYFDWAPKHIHEFIDGLDKRKHYLVYWPLILLCGDLRHVCGEKYLHVEHWLFTYSSKLTYKYLYVDGTPFEHLIAPLNLYKAVMIDKPLGLHLRDVRKPSKIAYKYIWQLFGENLQREALKGVDPYELVRRKALEIYGTDNLDEIGKRMISERVSKLPEYKGEYPSFLLKFLNS